MKFQMSSILTTNSDTLLQLYWVQPHNGVQAIISFLHEHLLVAHPVLQLHLRSATIDLGAASFRDFTGRKFGLSYVHPCKVGDGRS